MMNIIEKSHNAFYSILCDFSLEVELRRVYLWWRCELLAGN